MRLSDKASRDWYIDFLIEKGMPVEYWDVASLIYGEDGRHSQQTAYLRTPKSYREIERMLQLPENMNASYVMLVTYEGRTARLFRILSRRKCRMLFISWGALPVGHSRRLRKTLLNPRASALNFARKTKAAIYKKVGLVQPFDCVFVAGQVLMSSPSYANRRVAINLSDYDHYVRARSAPEPVVEGRYAVFLDIFLPHQSDLRISGMRPIEPIAYYRSLNRFFSLLEQVFDTKVVIAAHPKAEYDATTFDDRAIFRGVTPELVRDADFVISHHSTSLSYAVLNRKPIMFIYTSRMKALYELTVVAYLHELAAYLHAPLYNVDDIVRGEQIAVPQVDDERYEAFKYDFLTSLASENAKTQEIFWREVNAPVCR